MHVEFGIAANDRSANEGLIGQWHFGGRRPSGADHEGQPPELVGLDAARSWRCRGASYPRSRPDFSRWLEPALKPLFSRAVRTVAWNAVGGCGCRSRAADRAVRRGVSGSDFTRAMRPSSPRLSESRSSVRGGRIGVEEPLHAEPAHDTTAYLLGERGQIGLVDWPSQQLCFGRRLARRRAGGPSPVGMKTPSVAHACRCTW
jgi:hypothetical protein